jgi:hypothetical protein
MAQGHISLSAARRGRADRPPARRARYQEATGGRRGRAAAAAAWEGERGEGGATVGVS